MLQSFIKPTRNYSTSTPRIIAAVLLESPYNSDRSRTENPVGVRRRMACLLHTSNIEHNRCCRESSRCFAFCRFFSTFLFVIGIRWFCSRCNSLMIMIHTASFCSLNRSPFLKGLFVLVIWSCSRTGLRQTVIVDRSHIRNFLQIRQFERPFSFTVPNKIFIYIALFQYCFDSFEGRYPRKMKKVSIMSGNV